jgi:hypothetical protein
VGVAVKVTYFEGEVAKKTYFARETFDQRMYDVVVLGLLETIRRMLFAQRKQYLAASGVARPEGSLVSP